MRFSVNGLFEHSPKLSFYLLSALLYFASFSNSIGQVIECPAIHNNIQEVDFSHADCREVTLSDYVISAPSVWIKIPNKVIERPSSQKHPKGLFISGNMSLNAYINGEYIGRKGYPASKKEHELAGPFDWVGYIPKKNAPENVPQNLQISTELGFESELVLYASSHANLFSDDAYFNRIYIGDYGNTTDAYTKHYAPSLIPLGVLLIALIYLLSQRFGRTLVPVSLTLVFLISIAIVQLIVEVSRGFYGYVYWLHLPRLQLIALCSLLFGQCLLLYAIRHVSFKPKMLLLSASIIVTLLIQSKINDYDLKAIIAFQVPIVIGFCALGWIKIKLPEESSVNRINFFLILFALCLLVTLLTPDNFLDAYVYYLIAILVVTLTKLESDKRFFLEQKLNDTRQQANRLELALAIADKSEDNEKLQVKSAGQVNAIPVNNILFCKGAGDYVELVCSDESILYSGTLQQLQCDLPKSFLKVHRSYLVNAKYIVGIKRKSSGNGELRLKNESTVPVSRTLFAEIRNALADA